jgi:thioredoxin reductase (NADPH)
MTEEKVHDCIIIGAGPGGLQAAIYLGRYNMDVLLIDRGGGRTHHARRIENFLSHKAISGKEILEAGMEQARTFNVRIEKGRVVRVIKKEVFEVDTGDNKFLSRFVIISSGVSDNLPPIENLHKFLGAGYFTCMDCDGHKTTGRKLVVIGNSIHTVRLAFAMKEMYTKDITLILYFYEPPDDFKELLAEESIPMIKGRPGRFIGEEKIEAVELQDGRQLACEVVMADFGYKLNDDFISELSLKRDSQGFKYVTNHHFESSVDGLYIVGPLNTGADQAIIAAGEGAAAAIDIKKRLIQI